MPLIWTKFRYIRRALLSTRNGGGLLFAAAINRLTILRWIYWDGPEDIIEEQEWLKLYVKTGALPSPEADMPTTGYLTTSTDFRAEFTDFQEIELVGIESFAQWKEETLLTLSPEKAQAWLDLMKRREENQKDWEWLAISCLSDRNKNRAKKERRMGADQPVSSHPSFTFQAAFA